MSNIESLPLFLSAIVSTVEPYIRISRTALGNEAFTLVAVTPLSGAG